MHLLCPLCQGPIDLEGPPASGEILCGCCGSTFRVDSGATASIDIGGRRRLGRFELIQAVGTGTFGTVYRARDTQLDRIVALKLPRAGNLPGADDLDRFLREARSASRLAHPAIVPVHEVGQADGVPYIVSEFIEGITLADRLTAGRPSFRESAEIVAVVAGAIDAAHRAGVVHRDVKPSNIMLRPDGSPLVMDFGLAKREAGEVTMTLEGQVLGTPAYMSPEQARGDSHRVNGRSDVYSLGVILYQLLTGELPFRGNTRMLLHQVLHDDPRKPRSLNDRVPRDLETIALKAMAKEPTRRYATAGDLAADLRHWRDGEPILARPTGPAGRAWRWCRRNPGLATAATLAVTALVAVAGLATVIAVRERQSASAQARNAANLAREQEQTRFALAAARRAEARANDQGRRALVLAAEYALNRGIGLAEQGDPAGGLLWMARALETAPAGDPVGYPIRMNLAAWGEQINPLRAVLPVGVVVAAFSPDGRLVATSENDATVRLRRVVNGSPVGPPWSHPRPAGRVAFSPDGRLVLSASDDGMIQLHRAADGSEERPPVRLAGPSWAAAGGARVVAVAADLRSLWTLGPDRRAQRWDTSDGSPVGPAIDMMSSPFTFNVSPDGRVLVNGTPRDVGGARLVAADDGRPIGTPLRHEGPIAAPRIVAFRPDGRVLATGGLLDVRLWDSADGKPRGRSMPGRGSRGASTLAFSPDGRLLASGGFDRTVQLWDAADGSPVGQSMAHPDYVAAIAFSPDGRYLLTASANAARLWRTDDGSPVGVPFHHEAPVDEVAFGPDGRSALTIDRERTCRLWAISDRSVVGPYFRRAEGSRFASLRPDGRLVAYDGGEGAVRLRDLSDGPSAGADWAPAMEAGGPEDAAPGGFRTLSFTPDGTGYATGTAAGAVRLWRLSADLRRASPVGRPIRHGEAAVVEIAFRPDGRVVATVAEDGTLRLWDAPGGTPEGRVIRCVDAPPERWSSDQLDIAFSPDGRTVAAHMAGSAPRFWDAREGTEVDPPAGLRGRGDVAALGRDLRTFVAVERNVTSVHDARDGSDLGRRVTYPGPGFAQPLSPDGRMLLTSHIDGTVRLWSVRDGTPIGRPFADQDIVRSASFSTDGARFATAGVPRFGRRVTGRVMLRDVILRRAPTPLEGEPARAGAWARVLTGMTLDDAGAAKALDARGWAEQGKALGESGGPPHPAEHPALPDRAWHLNEAAAAEQEETWAAARWHLDRLVALAPDDATLRLRRGRVALGSGLWETAADDLGRAIAGGEAGPEVRDDRGRALAELGRFGEAAREYAEVVRLRDDWPGAWGVLAQTLLASGREGEDRKACGEMMRRFRGAGDRSVLEMLLYRCVWAPEGRLDFARLLDEAGLGDGSGLHPRIRGAVQFRLGHPERAIRSLDEAAGPGPRRAWDSLFLAMAHHRLGHAEEARAALAQAAGWVEAADRPEGPPDGPRWYDWRERLEVHGLLEEARRVDQAGP